MTVYKMGTMPKSWEILNFHMTSGNLTLKNLLSVRNQTYAYFFLIFLMKKSLKINFKVIWPNLGLIDKNFYENELKYYKEIKATVFKADFFQANELILNALMRFMIECKENLPGKEKILHTLELEITHLMIRHCNNIKIPETKISRKIEINQLEMNRSI